MQTVVHRAETRGGGDHGWLRTAHSFSFADWYDAGRMGFGALRVLNDDRIAPHQGFGMHSHDNFEIITIVMSGAVTHEDSLGARAVTGAEEVQVMSAGTGVTHAEKNDGDDVLELFQIWIAPNVRGAVPRYEQKKFSAKERQNKLQLLVSGTGEDGSLMIHQDAKIYRADLAEGKGLDYTLAPGRGVYAFVIEGALSVAGVELNRRDAIGVSDTVSFEVKARADSSVVLIEVPL